MFNVIFFSYLDFYTPNQKANPTAINRPSTIHHLITIMDKLTNEVSFILNVNFLNVILFNMFIYFIISV